MEKKGEGGVLKFSVGSFLSQSAEEFRRGTFSLSLFSGLEKKLCFRGFCHDFPSKFFCLTVPEHFVEEPFCAVFQIISGCEKVYGKEGGRGLSKLSVENFLSHSTETLVEETLSAAFQKIAGSEKVYGKEGRGEDSKFSVEKLLFQIAETFFRGTLYSFISFGYRKCLCFRGLCHNFPWNFSNSEYRTIP